MGLKQTILWGKWVAPYPTLLSKVNPRIDRYDTGVLKIFINKIKMYKISLATLICLNSRKQKHLSKLKTSDRQTARRYLQTS